MESVRWDCLELNLEIWNGNSTHKLRERRATSKFRGSVTTLRNFPSMKMNRFRAGQTKRGWSIAKSFRDRIPITLAVFKFSETLRNHARKHLWWKETCSILFLDRLINALIGELIGTTHFVLGWGAQAAPSPNPPTPPHGGGPGAWAKLPAINRANNALIYHLMALIINYCHALKN